jgi:urease accessory protein
LAGPLFAGIREGVRDRVDARPAGRLLEASSPLGGDGLLVRLAAESVQELLQALRTHLAAVPALLGDDPWRLDASHAA